MTQKPTAIQEAQTNLANGTPLLWVPAKVDLSADKQRLIWINHTETRHMKTVAASSDLLGEFTDLGKPDTSPEEIRNFAKRFGVLLICKHGLPATHSNSPNLSVYFGEDERSPYCRPLGTSSGNGENEGYEPVDRWRFFARYAEALLNVIVSLSQDELGEASEWKVLTEFTNPNVGRDLKQQRLNAVAIVNTWLRVANVIPRISYNHPPLSAHGVYKVQLETDRFRGSRLFAYIACQLMTAAVGQGVSLCSGCGKIYPPTRKPNRNQNNYCQDCGIRAAWRDAQERKRANPTPTRVAKNQRTKKTKKR